MRNLEVTVGDRHFSFYIYGGKVAVNVKFHGWPKPQHEEAQRIWAELTEGQKDQLTRWAADQVCEMWWEDIRETLKDYDIGCGGRSGGYLIFEKYTDGLVEEIEYDASREPCIECSNRYTEITPDEHAAHEAVLRNETPPLPFPDAQWELTCFECKQLYHEHLDGRCPLHLGRMYEPHAYRGDSLARLEDLDHAVAVVEKAAAEETVQRWVDDVLDDQILEHGPEFLEKNRLSEEGTDT